MDDSKILEIEAKRDALEEKLENLEEKLELLYVEDRKIDLDDSNFLEKTMEIHTKKEQVFQEMDKIREEIDLLLKPLVASNETLDIYLENGGIRKGYGNFSVFLHGTSTRIGHVRLNRENNNVFGNVGYGLDAKYRGHHFMLQSLNLLKKTMLKMKIVKPVITVEPKNIASVKTIQAFGGVLTESHKDNDRYYDTYEVDLSNEEATKKR